MFHIYKKLFAVFTKQDPRGKSEQVPEFSNQENKIMMFHFCDVPDLYEGYTFTFLLNVNFVSDLFLCYFSTLPMRLEQKTAIARMYLFLLC